MKVVCFDLGDVLVRLRFARCPQALCRLSGRTPAEIGPDARLFLDDRGLAYSAGQMAPDTFLAELAREFGAPQLDRGLVAAAWCAIFDPWPEMERVAEDALASGAMVWLLSNTDPMHIAYLWPKMPILAQMDGLHLSYEVGVNKPDPRYFELFLQRTGFAAADCIYFDDRADNVAAAARLGFRAHLHTGEVAQVRQQLIEFGIVLADFVAT